MQPAALPAAPRQSASPESAGACDTPATAARDRRNFEREVARARKRLDGSTDDGADAEARVEPTSTAETKALNAAPIAPGLPQLVAPTAPAAPAAIDATAPGLARPSTSASAPSLPSEAAPAANEFAATGESAAATSTSALGESRATHPQAAQAPSDKAHELEATADRPAALAQPARTAELAEQRAADILRQVRLQLVPASGEAHVRLDPPELGAIAIRLVVREGRVDAELRVEERATLDLLAKHIPELRATLARAGMHAGAFDLQLGLGEQRRGDTSRQRGARASFAPAIAAPRELRAALTANLGRDTAIDTYA